MSHEVKQFIVRSIAFSGAPFQLGQVDDTTGPIVEFPIVQYCVVSARNNSWCRSFLIDSTRIGRRLHCTVWQG